MQIGWRLATGGWRLAQLRLSPALALVLRPGLLLLPGFLLLLLPGLLLGCAHEARASAEEEPARAVEGPPEGDLGPPPPPAPPPAPGSGDRSADGRKAEAKPDAPPARSERVGGKSVPEKAGTGAPADPGAKAGKETRAKAGERAGEATAPRAKRPAPVARVRLPRKERVQVAELLPLLERLHALPVKPESPEIQEAAVALGSDMAGRTVAREELTLLLAAHRVFIRRSQAGGESVIVLSRHRGPAPGPSPTMLTRRFQVKNRNFEEIAEEVKRYLEEKNAAAPAEEPPSGAAMDPRTRLIIVRSASSRTLVGVDEIVQRLDRPDPGALHVYSYVPLHLTARELREAVLEALGEAQAARVSLVVPQRGNVLMIRATEELHGKVEEALKAADVPGKRRPRVSVERREKPERQEPEAHEPDGEAEEEPRG